ncbi:thioredoxin-like protein [Russula compacta]|nr:thioredoxin-like protein [Russula compacta]
MPVVPLTSLAQFNNIINADRAAVIYFWAYWCGPCRGMTPIFNGAADSGSFAGVDFYRVDIDHANDVVQHVNGQTVPGFYVYHRGQKLGELVGANPAELQVRTGRSFVPRRKEYSNDGACIPRTYLLPRQERHSLALSRQEDVDFSKYCRYIDMCPHRRDFPVLQPYMIY